MSLRELLDRFSLNGALASFPSTNARIFVTILGFIATGMVYLYLLTAGLDDQIDESVFGMWLGFLSVWAGVDVYQYTAKRKTHMESPPVKPDVENAQAAGLISPTPPVITVPPISATTQLRPDD